MGDVGHLAFYLTPIAVDDAPQSPEEAYSHD
jgi:hypothetical protein